MENTIPFWYEKINPDSPYSGIQVYLLLSRFNIEVVFQCFGSSGPIDRGNDLIFRWVKGEGYCIGAVLSVRIYVGVAGFISVSSDTQAGNIQIDLISAGVAPVADAGSLGQVGVTIGDRRR